MSRISSSPSSLSSSVTTAIYAPLAEALPALGHEGHRCATPSSVRSTYKAPHKSSSFSLKAEAAPQSPAAPRRKHLPLMLSGTMTVCAIAGIGVAAAFFPIALALVLPVALLSLVLVTSSARVLAVENAAAIEPAPTTKRPFSPTPSEPKDMPASMMRGIKQPLTQAAHAESRALAMLEYLKVPSRFCPDVLIGPLAQARSYKARLWERDLSDEKSYVWQSLDLAERFFDSDNADDPTVHLAIGERHFWTLQMHEGQVPKCDDFGGTKLYEMRVQRFGEVDDVSSEKCEAFEILALGGGDCLFHAWATAENFDGYNELSASDIEGKQQRADTLRQTAVTAAIGVVRSGNQAFIQEMARAADEEFNVNWLHAQQQLAYVYAYRAEPALVKQLAQSVQESLFKALSLLSPHQTEARDAVRRRLQDAYRLEQASQPQS